MSDNSTIIVLICLLGAGAVSLVALVALVAYCALERLWSHWKLRLEVRHEIREADRILELSRKLNLTIDEVLEIELKDHPART